MSPGIPFWFCAVLLAPALASAQEPPFFQVKGYGIHEDDQVVYHYRVINNSPTNAAKPAEAVIVEIGRMSLDHEPQLTGLPPAGHPPVYDSGVLDIAAPPGWKGSESGEQEHVRHTIRWETAEAPSPHTLLPGHTLTGLRVTRREANSTYLDSHFRVVTNDSRKFTGRIEREDTTAPTLSVSVTPNVLWPPNGKLMPVNVTMSVKDDYDPAPEVKLESVTANEPLAEGDIAEAALGSDDRQFKLAAKRDGGNKTGRIYTITYSATDATGNKATASTTVTVPHEGQSAR